MKRKGATINHVFSLSQQQHQKGKTKKFRSINSRRKKREKSLLIQFPIKVTHVKVCNHGPEGSIRSRQLEIKIAFKGWGGYLLSSLGFYSAPFQARISVHIGTSECVLHSIMCLVVHITCVKTEVCMAH